MAATHILVVVLLSLSTGHAVNQQDSVTAAATANPIRKVVTMLQALQKKVNAQGAKEGNLYEKFSCYCRNGAGELSKSISESEAKAQQLGSDISAGEAKKKQMEEDLKNHQSDRAAAKSAMSMATVLREKDATAFAKDKSTYTTNIDSLGKAITAITKGMSGAFLQTDAAQVLKTLVLNQASLLDADRQDIMAFLSGSQGGEYVPQSGDIVGVLKGIKDEMAKGLAESEASELASINSHSSLMSSKRKELAANNNAIETKSMRVGSLSVSIAQMKTDLSNTQEGLGEDQHFLGDLDKNCATQAKEWEERTKTRSEELLAIAETIKVLNDDEALDLFKKALPGSSPSFVQMVASKLSTRASALSMIHSVRGKSSHRPQFDFIALAIQGKKVGFEKVLKMIDGMVVTLKDEQKQDDRKKDYCGKQFELSDDKRKGVAKTLSDLEISIQDATEGVATLKEEIKALKGRIEDLDRSVAEATEQRKSEHTDYTESLSSNSAAKELVKFATNRLNKFYDPRRYQPASNPALLEDQHSSGLGGTVFAEVHEHAAPPAPPATFDAYSKKTDEDGEGIIDMLKLLVKNLDKEMTEAGALEKEAQKDYEQMLQDAADKRALDSKTLMDKNVAKASMAADLDASKEAEVSAGSELMATDKYISSLHGECDFLVQYFDVRQQARTAEVDALVNAKAVLSGVDLSLLQRQSYNLRRQRA